MIILALDLGTKTGWAVKESGTVKFGTQNFKTERFEGGGMRYLRFERWLKSMVKQYKITEVYYEEVRRHQGTQAAHVYGGFEAIVTKYCDEYMIPYSSETVGTIKLSATGRGNANKEMMISAAIDKGYTVTDDNQADAIHLLLHVLDKINTGCEVMG